MLQEAGHIKNTNVLIFRHIQCLHLMYAELAWVLVSSSTQVRLQIILDPDYLPDYLSVSYDYAYIHNITYISKIHSKILIYKYTYVHLPTYLFHKN